MIQRCYSVLILCCLAVFLLGACSMQPPKERSARYQPAELLNADRFGLEPALLEPVDLLALNEDMKAFVRDRIPAGLGDQQKVEAILAAILEEGLALNYDNFKTPTAQQAFYTRADNCMSFTNLFVALAREAGVKARYQHKLQLLAGH